MSAFSQLCLFCHSLHGSELGLCDGCLSDLPFQHQEHSPQRGLLSLNDHICGACIASPPDFDRTIAAFRYEYPASQLLQHYKYHQNLTLADTFASILLKRLNSNKPDLIIPMPLHPQRLKERGFNQSLEIGRLLAKRLGVPIDFECNRRLDGMGVTLIDDVMTTGASLNALAKAVKAQGASHVECWVIARTHPMSYV